MPQSAFAILLLAVLPAMALGAAPTRSSGGQLLSAPTAEEHSAWLSAMRAWRDGSSRNRSLYGDRRMAWAQRSFVEALVIVQDRTLYDPAAGRYTVDRYLADVKRRYGGVDCVILWHTYPNIGIDDRNQHDHLRDMPGGIPGLRRMVAGFHRRGVRVLFPIIPWDAGTRAEDTPLATAMARDMAAIGADGLFGDTLNGIPRDFAVASPSLALEPELNLGSDDMLRWNAMSWGQFWDEPFAPGISAYRWLEPRHMVHVTSRWAQDRSGDLQRAFLNGTGYESWENVWGLWNGITSRDAASLRRIAAIERRFAPLLGSGDWEPYAATERPGVFASRFSAGGQALWTLVNRNGQPVSGGVLRVAFTAGTRYFDLWHGRELAARPRNGMVSLRIGMAANGFGAVLAATGAPPTNLSGFLKSMAAMPRGTSAPWRPLPQRLAPIAGTRRYSSAPAGMIAIPGGAFAFRVSGVEIEGDDAHGVDVQYPWEDSPRRSHERVMDVPAFYIDRTPVTNSQFRRFLLATRYRPRDSHNFLRNWSGGAFPRGWDEKPVTWVSLEDARAYAAWAGKRLPHEWEWQYAAQGTDGRAYPWGPTWDASAVPPPDTGRTMRQPDDVGRYPNGASPFGALDMVGSVWQWTEEVVDGHTRAAILRGGTMYRPGGSDWYFPPANRLDQHGKYLLMAPSKDRSGAIGFRCAADAAP
ncbi:MAG TPA: SUMF1/EgtB/PvdO family nonheme iron enzyme [Armatimonadota bacterium]|jgi:formylglycine-generating enzyme required for sulfatase activity